MGFDVENFGIGLATGWASAYAVYRYRRQINNAISATRQQASSAQNYATRSADGRYINDLVELAQRSHLAGRFAKLTDILVEPRFIPPVELAAPPDDEVVHSVFHVVPQIPDHPYLHAVYNLETLSIDDLATGDHALALLGEPGSGRTTALLTIALRSLGQVQFHKVEDNVQKRLDEEEAALTDKVRAQRAKERQQIEQRAREVLSEQHGIRFSGSSESATGFSRYIPVYVHLGNVNISAEEYGEQIDPAEPLVRAVQSHVGAITARTLPLRLYRRLAQGQALLLIDGLDDLPADEQQEKLIWLRELFAAYSDNFFIVTGSTYGYGPLAQMGLTPVFLRPWSDLDQEQIARHWAETWPIIGGTRRRPADRPEEQKVARAITNNRALSPVDLSLKIWATYADDTDAAGYEGWLRAFIQRHLPPKQDINDILPQMALIAALQLDEGFIALDKLEGMSGLDTLAAFNDDEDDETQTEETSEDDKAENTKENTSAQSKFLNMLRRRGLIVAYRGSRYQFRHPFVAAYLASLTLKNVAADYLMDKAENPAWSQALAYAAGHTSIEPAVKARLTAPSDLLQTHILEVSRWLSYSGQQVSWRGPLLKHIGNIMIAPNQYPLIRERAAAALIGTRDKNTLYVFRQAARNPNADVRRVACLGIGAIGDPQAAKDLIPLLEDQSDEVQLAAALALGAIGSEEALEALVISLTEGSEQMRQAVAESMASLPKDGYPVLFDAISHDDMMVRRAATFGLRRLGSRWSTDALYRAFLEDEQWYVRSAAQQAFYDLQQQEDRGPRGYPTPQTIPWLVEWAGQKGENIPSGEAASQILLNALAEGDTETRTLAARVLGQIGDITATRTLYATLRDRQESVRVAAHQSLADFEMQIGQALPAPS